MIKIFYAGVGEESATGLRDQLRSMGQKASIRWQKDGLGEAKADLTELYVNWGAYTAREYSGAWLNHRIHSNKFKQLERLAAASVPVPKYMMGKPGQAGWYARTFVHHDGKDLAQGLEIGDYYVKHIDPVKEYRVQVFKGEILRASLKVPMNDQAKLPFRTGDHWGFGTKDHGGSLGEPGKAAIKAVEALGYDFGGVDLGITKDGHPVVFEVNAAPWLLPGGDACRKYAAKIIEAL